MIENGLPDRSFGERGSANSAGSNRIGVLIVDDSALVRRMLTDMLSGDRDIEVLGTAGDAYMAREKIKQLNPDVLTLDVEMPKMDGVTFLRNIMRLRPMPVIMVSTLTDRGADVTLDALEVGAVDYLAKPKLDLANTLGDYAGELIRKIKMAARARVRPYISKPANTDGWGCQANSEATVSTRRAKSTHFRTTNSVIAIGASTGGTEAIKEVLQVLPPDAPGVLIAQHIPKAFSANFAQRMNAISQMTVCEAESGQQVLPGHAYVAPGDRHLVLVRDGARFVCELDDGPPVNRHIPSVDVLFRSVAQQAGRNSMGILLTGMGKDGAQGLKEMRSSGSLTIAQDEATSVVWGMPGEAVSLGAVQQVLSIGAVGSEILRLVSMSDVSPVAAG